MILGVSVDRGQAERESQSNYHGGLHYRTTSALRATPMSAEILGEETSQ